jgi:hypothetical protein
MNAVFRLRRAMLQDLALRTDVTILSRIKVEVLTRQQTFGLMLPVQYRDMRSDFPFR